MNCQKCAGFIASPNQPYGYSGPICYCTEASNSKSDQKRRNALAGRELSHGLEHTPKMADNIPIGDKGECTEDIVAEVNSCQKELSEISELVGEGNRVFLVSCLKKRAIELEQALKHDVDKIEAQYQERVAALESMLAVAVEALEFYAKYSHDAGMWDEDKEEDRGDIAVEALAKIRDAPKD